MTLSDDLAGATLLRALDVTIGLAEATGKHTAECDLTFLRELRDRLAPDPGAAGEVDLRAKMHRLPYLDHSKRRYVELVAVDAVIRAALRDTAPVHPVEQRGDMLVCTSCGAVSKSPDPGAAGEVEAAWEALVTDLTENYIDGDSEWATPGEDFGPYISKHRPRIEAALDTAPALDEEKK